MKGAVINSKPSAIVANPWAGEYVTGGTLFSTCVTQVRASVNNPPIRTNQYNMGSSVTWL